jgi:hypothetical protein
MPEKQLLPGRWLFVPSLPAETTDESLAEFIKSCGYELPLERISVRLREDRFGNPYATGMISIDENEIPHLLASLFEWMCAPAKLHGAHVKFKLLEKSKPKAENFGAYFKQR